MEEARRKMEEMRRMVEEEREDERTEDERMEEEECGVEVCGCEEEELEDDDEDGRRVGDSPASVQSGGWTQGGASIAPSPRLANGSLNRCTNRRRRR